MSAGDPQRDGPRAVRRGEELDLEALQAFLAAALPELAGSLAVRQFPSGHSNLTYLLRSGSREAVLRRPPFGRKARTAHDMGREFRMLSALQEAYPYVPRPLVFCDDQSVMGCDFYLMERLPGLILRRDLPAGLRLGGEDLGQLCRSVVDRLIDLHTIDFEAAGLGDFGKPEGYVRRQIEGWNKRYLGARTKNAPPYDRVMAWLVEKMPAESGACVIHGDFRLDNVVLSPEDPLSVIGVLDWEMATVGDPLMDLGNSLAYWVERGDPWLLRVTRLQPTTLPGMWTRDQVVDYYADRTGTRVECFDYYRVYGLFRLVVIMQQIYYRYSHRQTRNRRFAKLIYLVKYLHRYLNRLIDRSQLK